MLRTSQNKINTCRKTGAYTLNIAGEQSFRSSESRKKNYAGSYKGNKRYSHKFVDKPDFIELPFYPDLKVENPHGNLDPQKHFIVRASGDSMDGGRSPIQDGDLILLEINTGGTISNQIFAVEYQDEFGNLSYVLKRIEKQPDKSYKLVSYNKSYEPIPVDPETLKPFARLIKKL